MKSITDKVFIEDQYPGVTLGVVALPQGVVQIDAPPSAEDGRALRASLMNLSRGDERILVNLDSHFDRTLGARAMDCPIIAHEKIAEVFRNRPNIVKSQVEETGSDWESINGIGNVRWSPPEITFTGSMRIEWSDTPIHIDHHAGPSTGACWAIIPTEQVVFVGDLVVKNQAPFFVSAEISEWISSINFLLDNYQNFKVISGRGGLVTEAEIVHQRSLLQQIDDEVQTSIGILSSSDLVDKLSKIVLAAYTFPSKNKKQNELRLIYGFKQYLAKNARTSTHS